MQNRSLLSNISNVSLDNLPIFEPIVLEKAFPANRQFCDKIDEPLIEIKYLDYIDAYFKLDILPPRKPLVRSGLIPKLALAQKNLPKGFGIVILDTWRSISEQEILIDYYGVEATECGFVAQTTDDKMRPPHTTGGAVDITLSWNGEPLALGTEYDTFAIEAATDFYELSNDIKLKTLRRILASTMRSAGFAPYWAEWWHWSFGDDIWGWINGKNALYDIIYKERSMAIT